MSVYPSMSQSNLDYFLSLMSMGPHNASIASFGAWDSVSFFVSNSQDPENPTFKLVTVWGSAPPIQVAPILLQNFSQPQTQLAPVSGRDLH